MAGDDLSSSSMDETLSFSTLLHMMATIRLCSTNYLMWFTNVVSVLAYQDLFGYVDGTESVPPKELTTDGKTTTNPAYTLWCKKDQRVRTLLNASLTEESMAETIGCTTSRAAWIALQSAYNPTSTIGTQNLREELRSLTKGDLSVAEYGKKFKVLCDHLSALGKPVDDQDKSHWFLRGLGPSFSSFSAAQMTVDPLPSFRLLLPRAINHQLFEQSMAPTVPAPVAFNATKTSPNNQQEQYHRDQTNWRSNGQQNRNTYNGRNSNGYGQGGYNNGRNYNNEKPRYVPTCQWCNKKGHKANQCRQLQRYSSPKDSNSANLAEAFSAACQVAPPNDSDWYFDSGASAHMTPSSDSLDSSIPYSDGQSIIARRSYPTSERTKPSSIFNS